MGDGGFDQGRGMEQMGECEGKRGLDECPGVRGNGEEESSIHLERERINPLSGPFQFYGYMTLGYSLETSVRLWRRVQQRWQGQITDGMNLQHYSSDIHQPC